MRDIHPGAKASDPRLLTALNGVLLFVADDGIHGPQLWRSDGTGDGTQPIAPLDVGSLMAMRNGLLYFNGNGAQLWRTDGTAAGTGVFEPPALIAPVSMMSQ